MEMDRETMKSDDFYNENYQITQVIESVKQRKDVLTQDGRFRLAVRYCLVRKCLHRPIEYLRSSDKCDKYYVSDAILADEILIEILLSVIYQLNIVDFKLDLENSAFLDLSWELPRIINVDLVPSKDLGISVKYAGERPIITKIRANSVVHESADINIGDVIECINNVPVLSVAHGSLNTLLKTSRIQPVTLRLIKAITDPTKNTIHPAMIQLYKEIQLDPETVRASLNRNHNPTQGSTWRNCNLKLKALTGFTITYLGCVCVGRNNEAKAIDKVFANFFWPPRTPQQRDKSLKEEVLFEVGELGIKFSSVARRCLMKSHMFMEISGCSCITLMPNYFAYIAGNANSQPKFSYYFFCAPDAEIANVIMQLMQQGFRRTNYAV
ncbi:uncharacterized protein [Atheta coriaria]|uniref:uncharacterized protein n=1 Tax=Dalotia coriaria TaxID=877792 RepID=UPI0031F3D461